MSEEHGITIQVNFRKYITGGYEEEGRKGMQEAMNRIGAKMRRQIEERMWELLQSDTGRSSTSSQTEHYDAPHITGPS